MLGLNRRKATPEQYVAARAASAPRHRRAGIGLRDHSADDQTTQRDRRRRGLVVEYGPAFVLSDELAAVLGEPARRIAADPRPARWVARIARAVAPTGADDTVSTSVADAVAAIARAVGSAVPALPEPTAETAADGSWSAGVALACRTLDEPLSAALRRGVVVAGEPLRDHLAERLRDIDRATRALSGALDRTATTDRPARVPTQRVAVERLRARQRAEVAEMAARHRAELAQLRGLRHD